MMSRLLTLLFLTCLMVSVMSLTTSRGTDQIVTSSYADADAAAGLDAALDADNMGEQSIATETDQDLQEYQHLDSDQEIQQQEQEQGQQEEQDMSFLETETDTENDAELDMEHDIDMDMDMDDEMSLLETDTDEYADMDEDMENEIFDADQDTQHTALLETSTSTSTEVSYIAFGDKGLKGSDTQYGVVVNGEPCGVAVGVTGGLRYYDIVTTTNPVTGIQTKKFGNRNFATINVAFDRPNAVLTSWIKDTLNGKWVLRKGAVQADDGKGNLKASLSFMKAYITQVTFPKYDLNDPTPAIWKIQINPESTNLNQAADGAESEFRDATKKFKPFANNFRLSIGGEDIKGVRLIESFKVDTRRSNPVRKIKPLYQVGNLIFEVSQAEAGDLFFWMEKEHTKKKNGAITVFKPSGKVFYSITLKGLGVFKVHPLRAIPGQVRWLRVEIFVEQVAFVFDPKPSGAVGKSEKIESITVVDEVEE